MFVSPIDDDMTTSATTEARSAIANEGSHMTGYVPEGTSLAEVVTMKFRRAA